MTKTQGTGLTADLTPGNVSRLMEGLRQGKSDAAGELVELFYPELRRIAAAQMSAERCGHTLRPTALVNELYLELVKVKALRASSASGDAEREAFLNFAAYLMKRLLIHHSRPLARRVEKASLPDLPDSRSTGAESLLEVDDVLNRLALINPHLRTVVELKVFEGLTGEEIAQRMDCGTATVKRHWTFARIWLEKAFACPVPGRTVS